MRDDPLFDLIGVKLSMGIAGFFGGVVSLAFLRNLTRAQCVLAVLVGCFTAAYLTPVLMHFLNLKPGVAEYENGVAFMVGLSAMNLIPVAMKTARILIQHWHMTGQNPSDGDKP